MSQDYVALSRLIRSEGLLNRRYNYYTLKLSTIGLLLVSSILIMWLVDSILIQLLNAAFLAFIFVQVGLIMHDADHNQIFKSTKRNAFIGLITGNLLLSISSGKWKETHNKHHQSPNHEEEDPDINISVIAYTEQQALEKRGISRFITKYQAFFWFPLLTLQAFRMRFNYFRALLKNVLTGVKGYWLEFSLMVSSFVLYYGVVFFFLIWWQGIIFVLVHHALTGLYMGTVFATNHKGMPLLDKKWDYLRAQVLTTRNVKGSLLVDFWTGGLNYQIEHHLFPTMPRCNLSKARKIVRRFCKEKGIDYYETGFFSSYKEILQNFHQVSAVLRRSRSAGASI